MRIRIAIPVAACLALLGLTSCSEEDGALDSFTVEVSEDYPTVAIASWQTAESWADDVIVTFGLPSNLDIQATTEGRAGDSWQAVIVGLIPGTEYACQASVEIEGATLYSEELTFTTGNVPPDLPNLTMEIVDPDLGGFLLTTFVSEASAAVILDRQGNYVWWYVDKHDDVAVRRAQFASDRASILLLLGPADYANTGLWSQLVRVPLDGSDLEAIEMHELHHDFVQLPDGTLGAIRKDQRILDKEDDKVATGDTIAEIYPNGSWEEVWSLWDQVEYEGGNVANVLDGESHANALDFDEVKGRYYLSTRNLHTIYAVDSFTGETAWRFGGEYSDFITEEEGTELMKLQHQFQVLEDGLLVFDNGAEYDAGSRVVEYALNFEQGFAEVAWEYRTDPPYYCYALGDVSRFDNGNTLITWSTAGIIEEVTPDHEVVWHAAIDLGAGIGYTDWFESFYR